MSDILHPSPEYTSVDLLCGYPDLSEGVATEYFAKLAEDDREIVQWYAEQGILPELTLGAYVHDLVVGYHAVDPDRAAKNAQAEVMREMHRVSRYLELFLATPGKFPELAVQSEVALDEFGRPDSIEFNSWIMPDSDILKLIQTAVGRSLSPLIYMASRAVESPSTFEEYLRACRSGDWHC